MTGQSLLRGVDILGYTGIRIRSKISQEFKTTANIDLFSNVHLVHRGLDGVGAKFATNIKN